MELDNPGDASAPIGSKMWAYHMRYMLYRTAKDSTAKLREFQAYVRSMDQHKGYRLLPADEDGHPFPTVYAFLVTRTPYGAGYQPAVVDAIMQDTRDMLLQDVVTEARKQANQQAEAVAKQIGPKHLHITPDSDTKEKDVTIREYDDRGNTASYAMRRLAKDRPDLHAQCLEGTLTPNAAMVQAGFRTKAPSQRKTALEKIRASWLQLSPDDRATFLAEVQAAGATDADHAGPGPLPPHTLVIVGDDGWTCFENRQPQTLERYGVGPVPDDVSVLCHRHGAMAMAALTAATWECRATRPDGSPCPARYVYEPPQGRARRRRSHAARQRSRRRGAVERRLQAILEAANNGLLAAAAQQRTPGRARPARAAGGLRYTQKGCAMDTILAVLIFLVLVAMLWDIRRTQLRGQASLERIEESAERIAQMTAEVLRRTPAP
jgi:hypothetical protein